jgi:hypothetical protein
MPIVEPLEPDPQQIFYPEQEPHQHDMQNWRILWAILNDKKVRSTAKIHFPVYPGSSS